MPPAAFWLVLSAALFSVGLYGVLTRRNAIGVLMAVELMLNAAALNFVAFNAYGAPGAVDGQVMAVFVIAVAAAEVVVAMAVFVALYQRRKSVDVTEMTALRNHGGAA